MSDEKIKLITRAALVFLIFCVIFCISAVCVSKSQKNYMERQRLENETELALMQMPSAAPAEEAEAEDIIELSGITDNSNANMPTSDNTRKVVVLDAGHGKSSSAMSDDEKTSEDYVYSNSRGGWGEWRHYKNGTFGKDCEGSGCTGTAPGNGSCWYPMGNGDRDTEPSINMNNAIAAKKYLEQMGYEVRMTRTSNEQNPSMNKRVSYCFPNNDINSATDASVYVCIHSNAGGGSGSSYISLDGSYTQRYIAEDYIEQSNKLADIINKKIAAASGLALNNPIDGEEYLILFNKCPVPIAYLEIGFFDNSSDLNILQSSGDLIGRAIAEGVDEYMRLSV